ncbi:MAG: FG-GAP-like repeat-containing protein [Myxococcaceae bacterium]
MRNFFVTLCLLSLTACGVSQYDESGAPEDQTGDEQALVAHTYDFAQKMPNRLNIMMGMNWFGIDDSDPQGGAGDPGWVNWHWEKSACKLYNDPATCSQFGSYGLQRSIASRGRPLAGIHSWSGRNEESLRYIDLVLSTISRPCDQAAKIDAFAPQLGSIKLTSRYGVTGYNSVDIPYRSMMAMLARAEKNGMAGVIMPAMDSTWYFHFGPFTDKASRMKALREDFADMARISAAHSGAYKVNGKPVFLLYIDAAHMSVSEWQSVLAGARNDAGIDFYVICTEGNGDYFAAFDAMAPWISTGWWNATSGATLYDHAMTWTQKRYAELLANVGKFPGRALFGGMSPGFNDYTEDWGACTERQIPRDPQVMQAQYDYLWNLKQSGQVQVKGFVQETWDDWTEGSYMEPDVAEGAKNLFKMGDLVSRQVGESVDHAAQDRVAAKWAAYGQPRNCSGAKSVTLPPLLDLHCSATTPTKSACSMQFSQVSNAAVGGFAASTRELSGDVNGDGKTDRVRVWDNGGNAYAQTLLSNGTSYDEASDIYVGGFNETGVKDLLFDADGDKKADLIRVWNNGGTAYAQVTLSTGTAFKQASNNAIAAWQQDNEYLVGDVNADGKKDLVVIHRNGNSSGWTASAEVNVSSGSSFFQASDSPIGGMSADTTDLLMDVNGDGKDDLVRVWNNNGAAWAHVNLSNGSAFSEASNGSVGEFDVTNRIFAADVNGDGKDDLVIVALDATRPVGSDAFARVLLSKGTGFSEASNLAVGGWDETIDQVGDVNGDGRADLVRLWKNGSDLWAEVKLSNGGSFVRASNKPVGGWGTTHRYALTDLNGDKRADLSIVWDNGGTAHAMNAVSSCQ